MNKFKKFSVVVIFIEIVCIVLFNGICHVNFSDKEERIYRVEAKRVIDELEQMDAVITDGAMDAKQRISKLDLSKYETIREVSIFNSDEICTYDYVVMQAGDNLYRIAYEQGQENDWLAYSNFFLGIFLLGSILLLWYLERKVMTPFYNISKLPTELAKGNLSMPIKEEKSKFFGHFLWGMDMLRDRLETNKEKELELQKEKKTMLLSLTHDIKTPLSAIRLYTKAVANNLYNTPQEKQEALQGIEKNVSDIESYVNEIVKTAREDFLNLEVVQGEFYVSKVMDVIERYYKEKLALIHTEFKVKEQTDCLLDGDAQRVVEVLQNVMENAIKYGDGKWIEISGEDEEDCRLITITNSGCDIKEEERPNLFDSFYRGSNSQSVKGSGLGLYICKNLMRQMDGDIFAKCLPDTFAVTVVVRKA